MKAVPEEVFKETAAAGEPPGRLASPEFFFLLQRIDRLDEKLSARTDALEQKLFVRVDRIEEKVDRIRFWAIGTVVAVLVGFAGVIVALFQK